MEQSGDTFHRFPRRHAAVQLKLPRNSFNGRLALFITAGVFGGWSGIECSAAIVARVVDNETGRAQNPCHAKQIRFHADGGESSNLGEAGRYGDDAAATAHV